MELSLTIIFYVMVATSFFVRSAFSQGEAPYLFAVLPFLGLLSTEEIIILCNLLLMPLTLITLLFYYKTYGFTEEGGSGKPFYQRRAFDYGMEVGCMFIGALVIEPFAIQVYEDIDFQAVAFKSMGILYGHLMIFIIAFLILTSVAVNRYFVRGKIHRDEDRDNNFFFGQPSNIKVKHIELLEDLVFDLLKFKFKELS